MNWKLVENFVWMNRKSENKIKWIRWNVNLAFLVWILRNCNQRFSFTEELHNYLLINSTILLCVLFNFSRIVCLQFRTGTFPSSPGMTEKDC